MKENPTRQPGDDTTRGVRAAASRFGTPELPRHHVPRPRGLDLLTRADAVPLVVVVAPAGTGKTSLVAEWVKSGGRSGDTAWVTFDGGDGALGARLGPGVFWNAVLRCLDDLGVAVGHDPGPAGSWLPSLAAAVVAGGRRLTLVLDDHHLASDEVMVDVELLLRLTAGRLRLVLVGRHPPALPLYRYRMTDAVLELGFAELAFDDAEAAALLAAVGTAPGRPEIHALNAHHHGWAAGLVLAGRGARTRSATAPAAPDLDVADYLRREVIDALPGALRRFVLGTCLPDEFDDALAEEVAGPGADDLLRAARAVAFALPSSREGHHTYPPVVRAVLRSLLVHGDPHRLREIRAATARWSRRRGAADDAVREFAAAGAWDELAETLANERLLVRLVLEGAGGSLAPSALRLRTARTTVSAAAVVRAAGHLAVSDPVGCADELARVPAHGAERGRAAVAAARSRLVGDAATALRSADAAARVLGGELSAHPAGALPMLVRQCRGVALLRHGAFELARAAFEDAADHGEVRALRADGLAHLALTGAVEGTLADAEAAAADALELAGEFDSALGGHATAHVALALVALDREEFIAVRRHLNAAQPVVEPLPRYLAHHVTAALDAAEGNSTSAANRLHAAAAEARGTDPWIADRLRIEAARGALLDGHPGLALHELDVLTRPSGAAAVLAAAAHARRGRAEDDTAAGRALAAVADGFPSVRDRVEALLVEADLRLNHHTSGRAEAAVDAALRLAAPHHLRLPFRHASPAVRALLAGRTRPRQRPAGESPGDEHVPVEALTAREREVLGHLTELLTTEEIAAAMFVSVNTVRTHVRGILRKLGVHRRYAAVRRARELGLLDR
ncbi:LuxR C-terminal-related transcriptional regulator [Saccharomonospora piscinae]|uniref:LuxR C-terminal-related transcriptional regulator n=1 Tax=Saccharomonospora piscinae TaxID=687388 RepID=UPI00244A4D50|nr:LuxR C-terminal-related transcriptional regulator [Saccharomonospora piscinae]